MALERETSAEIINAAALELGIPTAADPFASTDPAMLQLCGLLTTAGRQLTMRYPWEQLRKSHAIVTTGADTGTYELPDDFNYMVNQTGWERTNRYPLLGPSTPQEWAFLIGRGLISSTIYVTFRMNEGEFEIFPNDPVTDGLNINFDYISRYWVQPNGETEGTVSKTETSDDTILFESELIKAYLKVKWLDAKGFDSTKAEKIFGELFDSYTGADKGADIVSAGNSPRGFPYLSPWRNLPDGGFNT